LSELKQAERSLRQAQERLASIYETMPGAVYQYRVDADGKHSVPFISPGVAALYGVSADAAMAEPQLLLDRVLAQDRACVLDQFYSSARNGTPWFAEYRVNNNGKIGWLRANALPVRQDDGGMVWSGIVTDITEEKLAEHKLRDREAHLAAILENIADAVITIFEDGRIESVNASTTAMFGWSDDELRGKDIKILMPALQHGAHDDYFSRYLKTGKDGTVGVVAREVTGLRADGSQFPVELMVSEMVTSTGRGFVGVIRDISPRRQREEKTQELQSQIEQSRKMEAMGTLAGGIAHDINNALVPIQGLAGLTADILDADSPAAKNLERIADGAARIGKLTQRILAFSRQGEVQDRKIDIHWHLVESLEFLRPAVPSTIAIIQNINPEVGEIFGDETQFNQIIMNLLTNAVHALDGGPGRIKITLDRVDIEATKAVRLKIQPGDHAWIRIADNGPGIPKEVLHRIFDPFFTTKPVGEGTGLGLSVVHGIITSHGGMITATNRESGGAAFDVYWPLACQEV